MSPAPDPALTAWLERLNALDPTRIELGLERVRLVAQSLGILSPPARVLTVAGTNGKGSTVALAEAVALAAGLRVACYTSPHILRFNERLRINGVEASDTDIVAGLDAVEAARAIAHRTVRYRAAPCPHHAMLRSPDRSAIPYRAAPR